MLISMADADSTAKQKLINASARQATQAANAARHAVEKTLRYGPSSVYCSPVCACTASLGRVCVCGRWLLGT